MNRNPSLPSQLFKPECRKPKLFQLWLAHLLCATLCLQATLALAACPSMPTASRFTFSSDGTQVTDKTTGLVWARCSAGQTWDASANKCNDQPSSSNTHEQALQYAQTKTGWRLPNVSELDSLVEAGCSDPTIDLTAFPNTPQDTYYWSSTPYAENSKKEAWLIYFGDGYVNHVIRTETGAVRLVRASQ